MRERHIYLLCKDTFYLSSEFNFEIKDINAHAHNVNEGQEYVYSIIINSILMN